MKPAKVPWKMIAMPLVYTLWTIGSIAFAAAIITGTVSFCVYFPIIGISAVCLLAYCVAICLLWTKDWPWKQ